MSWISTRKSLVMGIVVMLAVWPMSLMARLAIVWQPATG